MARLHKATALMRTMIFYSNAEAAKCINTDTHLHATRVASLQCELSIQATTAEAIERKMEAALISVSLLVKAGYDGMVLTDSAIM